MQDKHIYTVKCELELCLLFFSGPHLNALTDIIIKVTWKTLASELGIREVDIYTIDGNCRNDENAFRCYRREMILTYCSYKTVNEVQTIPCDIAAALDRIRDKYAADNVRKHFPNANCDVEERKLEGANNDESSSIGSGIQSSYYETLLYRNISRISIYPEKRGAVIFARAYTALIRCVLLCCWCHKTDCTPRF